MKALELTKFLVNNIVSDIEEVSFKEYLDNDTLTIEILASKEEIKNIIGKKGTVANAIRTIVQTSCCTEEVKRIYINIDSF